MRGHIYLDEDGTLDSASRETEIEKRLKAGFSRRRKAALARLPKDDWQGVDLLSDTRTRPGHWAKDELPLDQDCARWRKWLIEEMNVPEWQIPAPYSNLLLP